MTADRPTLQADLALAQQNGDFATEAACLMALGDIAQENEEYDLAQGLYMQARAVYKKTGSIQAEARSVKKLADAFPYKDQTALPLYDTAHALFKSINDRQGEAQVLKAMGDRHSMSNPVKANEQYQQAIIHFRAVTDRSGEAGAFTAIGRMFFYQEEYSGTVKAVLNRALSLYEQLGEQHGMEIALYFLITHAARNKEFDLSLTNLNKLTRLYEQMGRYEDKAFALLYQGRVLVEQDRFDEAVTAFEQVFDIYRQDNCVNAYSLRFKKIDDLAAWVTTYKRLRKAASLAGDLYISGYALIALMSMIRIILDQKGISAAWPYMQEALSRSLSISTEVMEDLVSTQIYKQDYDKARAVLDEAVKILLTRPDSELPTQACWFYAEIDAMQNPDEKVRDLFVEGWDRDQKRKSMHYWISVLWQRGRFEQARGNATLALDYFAKALVFAKDDARKTDVNRWFPIDQRQKEYDALAQATRLGDIP